MAFRRKKASEGPTVTFDVKARYKYLTGFRKRKKERQRVGHAQVAEKERQDKINVKWEHREEVKKRWKELQWAERRVDKLFGANGLLGVEDPGAENDGKSRRRKRQKAALLHSAAEERAAEASAAAPKSGGPVKALEGAPVTIAYDAEDDDPFGGCEVITTVGAVAGPSAASAASADAADADGAGGDGDPAGRQWLATRGERGSLALARKGAEERGLAVPLSGPEEEARRRRRTESLRKEEARRQVAASKKLTKSMLEKKKMKQKKGKKDKKVKKGAKVGAKARRRRK